METLTESPVIRCEEPRKRAELDFEALEQGRGPWFALMAQFSRYSDERLAGYDTGLMNLLTAVGLPRAENLRASLEKLDAWTTRARVFTERNAYKFPNDPAHYGHSLAKYRMIALATVLHRELGVQYYMPFSEGDYDASDSRNLFIHGLLESGQDNR
jgi:hypothetical protein